MSRNIRCSTLCCFGLFALFPFMAGAKPIAGTGSISGSVTAPAQFKAAQVYALNVDKQIQYIVYTAGGNYRAINLFPGNYEVRVEKKGLVSDVQHVVVSAGKNTQVDFSLRAGERDGAKRSAGHRIQGIGGSPGPAKLVPFDTLYPPGPGRDALAKNCLFCHNQNYIPERQWTREMWEVGVDLLLNVGGPSSVLHHPRVPGTPALISSSTISLHPMGDIEITAKNTLSNDDRELILDYLAENFGPDSTKRAAKELVEPEIPLDESALANAMYIEYRVLPNPEVDIDGAVRQVQDPHFDRDGNVWFTDRGTHNRMGKLDPRSGEQSEYMMPDPRDLDPHGMTIDEEGDIWWVEEFGNFLGRLNPTTGVIDRWSMNIDNAILGGLSHDPALDSKQNVWFSIMSGNHLGKWDRKTEKITLYKAPTQGQGAYGYGITVARNDKVWFVTYHRCELTMFDPVTEKFSSYNALADPSAGGCVMRRLDEDADGAIWYGIFSHGKIGKLDPSTGEQEIYDMPVRFGRPYGLQVAPDGNVWTADDTTGMVRFNPKTKKFTYFPSPQKSSFPKMEITREGAIWNGPRDRGHPRVHVLYPDVNKMTTLGAYY